MKSKLNWWNLKLGLTELEQLQQAFQQKKISYNSIGAELEKKIATFLNVKHVQLTTSGSTALLASIKALGVGPGDEVIVPNRTFQATANAVVLAGARVVLADVDPNRATLGVANIEKAMTSKTKAVIPVHLNGRACEMQSLVRFCSVNRIKIIEDSAQAFCSFYQSKALGTFGEIGCFSMGTTKFLTTGQGGFIATNETEIYNEVRKFIFHACEGEENKRFENFGFNFRLSDLLSSLAIPQMNAIQKKRELFLKIYKTYQEALLNLNSIKIIPSFTHEGEIPIWIEILSPYRDQLFDYLAKENIESYKFYPSLHRSKYLSIDTKDFPASIKFETQGLILPCGPHIENSECQRVIDELVKFDTSLPI